MDGSQRIHMAHLAALGPNRPLFTKQGSFGSLFFWGYGSLTKKRDRAHEEIRTTDLMVRSEDS